MPALVTDTHALMWYFLDPGRLSAKALAALDQATAACDPICLPTIAIVEVCYLVEKGKLPRAAFQRLIIELEQEPSRLTLISLDSNIARAVEQIPRHLVPDMPDRIIAATAFHLGLPLVTRDAQIRSTSITTIW
jgi:PIN domain nuclease of toxin-antitoxin system